MENPHKARLHNLIKMVRLIITRAVPQLARRMRKKEQEILVQKREGGGGRDRVCVYVMPELRPTGLNPAAYSIRKVEQFLFPTRNAFYATFAVCHNVPARSTEVSKILQSWQK